MDKKMTFHNVGQGNFTFVTSPGHADLVIDMGSSMNPLEPHPLPKTWKEDLRDRISRKIQLTMKLDVIVTHADRDHLNMLAELFALFVGPTYENLKLNILLGGDETNYYPTDE